MNKSVKVVIVLDEISRGGAETQALYLANELVKKGREVHVISFGKSKGSYWENFEKIGVKLHLTGYKAKLLIPSIISLKLFIINIKYNLKFIKLLRTIKTDFLLPYTYPPNIICARIWKWTTAKACYWNQRDGGIMFEGRQWEIKALENCSKIISNSIEGSLFLEKYTNKEIIILHNGVLLPEKIVQHKPKGKIRVTMIANLHGYKDHFTLLKAWKKVISEIDENKIELIFAGAEGSTAKSIYDFIENNNLRNSVKCIGSVTDVTTLLLDSDIGVFSSLKEGLPNGILECMAVGLPVVATRINGAEEALGVEYPYLSNQNDEISMSKMIIDLASNHFLRIEIGIKNRERIENLFTIDKMVSNYEQLFNK